MHQPSTNHWVALKHVIRYLHGALHHVLLLQKSSPLWLHAFADAGWARDKDTWRNTTGYIVYLGQNPIFWSSKRQPTFAMSFTEAEFRAIALATTEVQWLISFLSELGFTLTLTPTIYYDYLSATHYSANPLFYPWLKYLALNFHFVREKVQDGTLHVTHIRGNDQLVDALTKNTISTRNIQDWTYQERVHLTRRI